MSAAADAQPEAASPSAAMKQTEKKATEEAEDAASNGARMIQKPTMPKHLKLNYIAFFLTLFLVSGCGDQVVVEGVDLNDDQLVGDRVIDTEPDNPEASDDEGFASGNPYQEAVEDEKNMGPNAPGYIPETIQ